MLCQIVNKLYFIPPTIFPHLLVGFVVLALPFPSGSPRSAAVDLVLKLSTGLNFAQGFSGDPFFVLVLLWT